MLDFLDFIVTFLGELFMAVVGWFCDGRKRSG